MREWHISNDITETWSLNNYVAAARNQTCLCFVLPS